jgi:hypothetical protein
VSPGNNESAGKRLVGIHPNQQLINRSISVLREKQILIAGSQKALMAFTHINDPNLRLYFSYFACEE